MWVTVLANALGATRFIAAPCMLYRRHEEALTISILPPKKKIHSLFASRLSRGRLFTRSALFRLELAEHLEKLAENSPDLYRDVLKEHAQDFRQSSSILRNRASLELEGLGNRSIALFHNIRAGAYSRTNNFGYGWRSLAVDVAKLCRIL